LFKLSRARVLAVSVGVGLFGSLASAPVSLAATQQPAVGTNCQADGHINGAGSTFQTALQQDAFAYGFEQDVCGPAPTPTNLYQGGNIGSDTAANNSYGTAGGATDPSLYSFTVAGQSTATSVNSMVAYNYSLNNVAAKNGSGAGLERLGCRTDFFAGTDLPYNTQQLTNLDAAPGTGQSCTTYSDPTGWNPDLVPPPFGPQNYGTWGSSSTGATAKAMAFPVAAGAVAFVANLTGQPSSTQGGCTITPSGVNLDLTPIEMDDIWQGTINQWNDSVLDQNNTWLYKDGCSGPIQRVVRQDNSGTTAITMFTLQAYLNIDGNTGLCQTPTGTGGSPSWYLNAIASTNTLWPGAVSACNDTNDSITDTSGDVSSTPLNTTPLAVTSATSSGSGPLIKLVLGSSGDPQASSGDIGYAELGLWPVQTGFPIQTGDVYVQLASPATQTEAPTADDTSPTYVPPSANPTSPGTSKCQLPSSIPTGSSGTAAVGLGSTTWTNSPTGDNAVINPTVGKQDVADPAGGTGYPACGLTFDLVYNKQNQTGEIAAPDTSNAATAGCRFAGLPPVVTVGDNPSGSTSLTVQATIGYPATGTLSLASGLLTYVSSTATSFKLAVATSLDIPAGSVISLSATAAPATASAPGVDGGCQAVDASVNAITNDQQRTLYSYFTYVLSPLGQDQLSLGSSNSNVQNQTLDPVPSTWLQYLAPGFQANF
jgi:hypothetical protein